MTKQFDLAHLPDGVVVVDKDANINGICYYADIVMKRIHKSKGDGFRTDMSDSPFKKIIAASPSLKLEGIPLLPKFKINVPSDKEIYDYVTKEYKNSDNPQYYDTNGAAKAFKDGYKANPKQYSREDVLKAIQFGADMINYTWQLPPYIESEKRYAHKDEDFKVPKPAFDTDEEFINSLSTTKLPIAVVLEMEQDKVTYIDYPRDRGGFATMKPKTDAQGYVIVKEWIYAT